MDQLHSEGQRKSDSLLIRYLVPVAISIVTSFIGGIAGAYMTLQLHEFRLNVLEQHVREDQVKFTVLEARQAALTGDMSVMRERHRLEDLGILYPKKKVGKGD